MAVRARFGDAKRAEEIVHRPADVAARPAWARVIGDEERRLVQCAEQQAREDLDRSALGRTWGKDVSKPLAQQRRAVVGVDLAPRLPAENSRPIDEHDPLKCGLERRVEEGGATSSQLIEGVARAHRGRGDLRTCLLLE